VTDEFKQSPVKVDNRKVYLFITSDPGHD